MQQPQMLPSPDPRYFVPGVPHRAPFVPRIDARPVMQEFIPVVTGQAIHEIQQRGNENDLRRALFQYMHGGNQFQNQNFVTLVGQIIDYLEVLIYMQSQNPQHAVPMAVSKVVAMNAAMMLQMMPNVAQGLTPQQLQAANQLIMEWRQIGDVIYNYQMRQQNQQQGIQPMGADPRAAMYNGGQAMNPYFQQGGMQQPMMAGQGWGQQPMMGMQQPVTGMGVPGSFTMPASPANAALRPAGSRNDVIEGAVVQAAPVTPKKENEVNNKAPQNHKRPRPLFVVPESVPVPEDATPAPAPVAPAPVIQTPIPLVAAGSFDRLRHGEEVLVEPVPETTTAEAITKVVNNSITGAHAVPNTPLYDKSSPTPATALNPWSHDGTAACNDYWPVAEQTGWYIVKDIGENPVEYEKHENQRLLKTRVSADPAHDCEIMRLTFGTIRETKTTDEIFKDDKGNAITYDNDSLWAITPILLPGLVACALEGDYHGHALLTLEEMGLSVDLDTTPIIMNTISRPTWSFGNSAEVLKAIAALKRVKTFGGMADRLKELAVYMPKFALAAVDKAITQHINEHLALWTDLGVTMESFIEDYSDLVKLLKDNQMTDVERCSVEHVIRATLAMVTQEQEVDGQPPLSPVLSTVETVLLLPMSARGITLAAPTGIGALTADAPSVLLAAIKLLDEYAHPATRYVRMRTLDNMDLFLYRFDNQEHSPILLANRRIFN